MKNIIRIFTLVLLVMAYQSTFNFLALNVFLAYIPIELSFQLSFFKNKYIKIILALFAILFFPNIPYLVTDLIHMDLISVFDYSTGLSSEHLSLWLLVIGMFSAVYCYNLIGFTELLNQLRRLGKKFNFNQLTVIGLLTSFSLLSALGMYAGRFAPRLNSVDLLSNPIHVLTTIFFDWSYSKVELIGVFFILHVIIIGTILASQQLTKDAAK